MARNIFYILIIFYYFKYIYCVDYQYDRPNLKPQDVSVQFPKYNIKIAPAIVKRPLPIIYQEADIPNSSEDYQNRETKADYNNENHEPNIFYVESEPIRVIDYYTEHNYNNENLQPYHQEFHSDYNNEHIQPLSYHQEIVNNYNNGHLKPVIHQKINTDYNNKHEIQNYQPYYQQYYVQEQKPIHYEYANPSNNHFYTNTHQSAIPHEQYQPIITRQPIEIPHKINPEYLRNSENFDDNVGLSRKHKDNWFYTTPNWDQNPANNMNILRSSDPRAIIASHTSFVKFKNPDFGSSNIFFTKHKKYINTKHDLGGTNIHKNTHIHVHNRDANENDNNDIIGSHLFAGPRWRRDSTKVDHSRPKRGLLDLARLVTDPKAKLDIEKTSENVGAATRNVFEEDYSPMFHLTNALGSAQDSFHSFMND